MKFNSNGQLKSHRERAHEENKQNLSKFECDECQMKFNSIIQLKSHKERAHEETKQNLSKFECNECQMKFNTNAQVKNHRERTHKENEQNMPKISCNECKKMFNSYIEVKNHREKAHEFQCEECHMRFQIQADHDKHCDRVRQAQIEVFPNSFCFHCETRFMTYFDLKRHRATKGRSQIIKMEI